MNTAPYIQMEKYLSSLLVSVKVWLSSLTLQTTYTLGINSTILLIYQQRKDKLSLKWSPSYLFRTTDPLTAAVMSGSVDALVEIIKARGGLREQSILGCLPVHLAAIHGQEECLRILLTGSLQPLESVFQTWPCSSTGSPSPWPSPQHQVSGLCLSALLSLWLNTNTPHHTDMLLFKLNQPITMEICVMWQI